MTPGDLARVADIRARADAATKPPWQIDMADMRDHDGEWIEMPIGVGPITGDFDGDDESDEDEGIEVARANAEFIAAARADVPWLLDRLAAETERADKATKAWVEATGPEREVETAARIAAQTLMTPTMALSMLRAAAKPFADDEATAERDAALRREAELRARIEAVLANPTYDLVSQIRAALEPAEETK